MKYAHSLGNKDYVRRNSQDTFTIVRPENVNYSTMEAAWEMRTIFRLKKNAKANVLLKNDL
jgi:hypothetical protein